MNASRERPTTAADGDEVPLSAAAGDHAKGVFRCADCGLEPKQPLHLVPHGDAQVDAERKQGKCDQPEASVRRAAFARTPLAVLSLRSLTPIFATDGARVIDRYVRRWLPCWLSHPGEFSGLTGR